jgi:hypothetical protein
MWKTGATSGYGTFVVLSMRERRGAIVLANYLARPSGGGPVDAIVRNIGMHMISSRDHRLNPPAPLLAIRTYPLSTRSSPRARRGYFPRELSIPLEDSEAARRDIRTIHQPSPIFNASSTAVPLTMVPRMPRRHAKYAVPTSTA